MRRFLPGLLLSVLVTVTGCSTPQAPTESSQTTSTPGAPSAASSSSPATTPPPTPDAEGPLTVYSGRSQELIGPLLDRYTTATGVAVNARYGETAEVAALILEEGGNSPADVFLAQDAGALGALEEAGVLAMLPEALTEVVEPRFRSREGRWVGLSGRARVIVRNTDRTDPEDAPASVLDLVEPEYRGRVGWAPSNGSFQAFVTAMRVRLGEEETRAWLTAMIANETRPFENNVTIVEAVGRGEIDFGLVNHYYLFRFVAENPAFPVANSFPEEGDVGSLINVAGAGVLETSDQPSTAEDLLGYLLGAEAQGAFATETNEYPLREGIPGPEGLVPLAEIDTPDIDLSSLADLEGTLTLLREVGALL